MAVPLYSVASLQDRVHFVLKLYLFLYFVPGTNKIKYYFENSNKIFWVAAISAGRSLVGQQTLFYFRPCKVNSLTPAESNYNDNSLFWSELLAC